MLENLSIELDTFLNRFEVRPNRSYSFFLGSGTSVQSGIPTGGQLVWDFKRRLYCNHHKLPTEKFQDLESKENQKIIQDFIIAQKFLPASPSMDYSFYFEKCFQTSEDRKYFIQNKVSNAVPSIGHKCLGKMFVENITDCIFTTNFDELIESGIQAVKPGHSFLVISPEKHDRVSELTNSTYSKVIKLHGDYRYDSLQNTSIELQSLDSNLAIFLKKTLEAQGIVFAGYSGCDQSVIQMLESIVDSNKYVPHGLVWCLRHGQKPNGKVLELISRANKVNKHSGFLFIDNFDELTYLLYSKKCQKDESIEKASKLLVNKKQAFQMDFSSPDSAPFILNSIELSSYPSTAYSVDSGSIKWTDLKTVSSKDKVVFSLYKGKLCMWADKLAMSSFLAELHINQTPTSIDLYQNKLTEDSSFYLGMIYDGLLINFLRKGFKRFKKAGIYDPNQIISDQSIPSNYTAYEAIEFQLFWAEGKLRLLLAPTVFLKGNTNSVAKDPVITKVVNKIKSNRYNGTVGELLKKWRGKLCVSNNETFSIGEFNFTINTAFSLAGYPQTAQTHFFKRAKYYEEPRVIFSSSNPSNETIHPLKGLSDFGPYEFNLTRASTQIKLAIITSGNHFDEIKNHLDSLNSDSSNSNPKEQYLVNYPGFYKVFRTPLDVPNASDQSRVFLINERDIIGHSCIEFYDVIKKCIDNISQNKHVVDVLIIYIPSNWIKFRELKNDSIYFDLHDSVKLYSAKKGIKIQFIERKSLDNPNQLRVKWWLSQGLYVKGAGIPWKVNTTSPNTAYIGLGYALKDGKTLLAASQLFDERGQGLRVLLQPIRKHIVINRNPFMSKDDARRLITTLRESYFSSGSNSKLDRIVIHKSNFFNRDEIEGITQALDGIQNVELLQVQESNLWKGLRWNCKNENGKWINRYSNSPYHMFPIQRGSALQIDDFCALLWTDGSVQHKELANPNYNYYQSARGIPSPLLLRRFYGTDLIDTLIQDVLKLTKMNWNSGQLYKRLPVTIEFSKILAEMAKQSEQLMGTHAYDFRYFI